MSRVVGDEGVQDLLDMLDALEPPDVRREAEEYRAVVLTCEEQA
ncbi:hypothetical protein AB0M44_20710 [Streptosporangium subroseum]